MFVGLVAAAMKRGHTDATLPTSLEAVKQVCLLAEL
jgi:hypothetical protein